MHFERSPRILEPLDVMELAEDLNDMTNRVRVAVTAIRSVLVAHEREPITNVDELMASLATLLTTITGPDSTAEPS